MDEFQVLINKKNGLFSYDIWENLDYPGEKLVVSMDGYSSASTAIQAAADYILRVETQEVTHAE